MPTLVREVEELRKMKARDRSKLLSELRSRDIHTLNQDETRVLLAQAYYAHGQNTLKYMRSEMQRNSDELSESGGYLEALSDALDLGEFVPDKKVVRDARREYARLRREQELLQKTVARVEKHLGLIPKRGRFPRLLAHLNRLKTETRRTLAEVHDERVAAAEVTEEELPKPRRVRRERPASPPFVRPDVPTKFSMNAGRPLGGGYAHVVSRDAPRTTGFKDPRNPRVRAQLRAAKSAAPAPPSIRGRKGPTGSPTPGLYPGGAVIVPGDRWRKARTALARDLTREYMRSNQARQLLSTHATASWGVGSQMRKVIAFRARKGERVFVDVNVTTPTGRVSRLFEDFRRDFPVFRWRLSISRQGRWSSPTDLGGLLRRYADRHPTKPKTEQGLTFANADALGAVRMLGYPEN